VRGLRARTAFFILLASVPAFIALFIVARNDRSDARDDSADHTRVLAAAVADQYESLLDDTRTLLHSIGTIRANVDIVEQCQPALGAIVRQSPSYDNLLIIRSNGSVLCSARPVARPIERSRAEWFADTLDTGSSVGLDETDTADATGGLVVAVSFDDPDGRYVAAAQIRLDGLAAVVGATAARPDTSVALFDEANTLLYQRPPSDAVGRRVGDLEVMRALRGPNAEEVVVGDGPDGVERIYTGERLSEPIGAVAIAGIPTDVAYEGVTGALRARAFSLAVLTLIAIAAGLAFAHLSVIRRLRALVAMTRSIGAGDLATRSDVRTKDEIGELARSLDAMADELKAREAERTHLIGAIVEASEEERRRIAGDVHDDSIQVMSAHVMNLQLLRRRVDDPDLLSRIKELEESGRAATARLRDLVFELHSPTLEEHGLRAALQTLVDRAFEGEDVACTVSSTLVEEPPLPTAASAYRIAQEAIRNARQHADARTIDISVTRDGIDLVMRISDDGEGFDPSALQDRPGHLGLRGMRERAAAVGGSITIDAKPGSGTTISSRLPWLLEA
jgi:signal transduction histidine kinase